MFIKLILNLFLVCSFFTANALSDRRTVSKYGVVLENGDHPNIQVKMVQLGKENSIYYMIQVTGINTPLDGKIEQYEKKPTSNGGFYYEKDGKNLLLQSGESSYELYIGQKTYRLFVNSKATKALDTKTLQPKE